MAKQSTHRFGFLCMAGLLAVAASAVAAPKGAKAIFDSGDGGTIGMSAAAPRPATPTAAAERPERYVGISYQILMVGDDGQIRAVPKSRVFTSGERIRIIASTNRPGYLTVANIGPSGRMNVLFSEYVDARRLTQIPANGNLRFDATPGTERVLLMLSNEPSPLVAPTGGSQQATLPPPGVAPVSPPVVAAPATVPAPMPVPVPVPSPAAAPAPTMENLAMMQPPGMKTASPEQARAAMVASIDGAKTLKVRGAKDLLVEDRMESTYSVVSPRDGYRTVSGGAKDLVVESTAEGMNYGVVPVSAVSAGGILTLEINLRHR